MGWSEYRNGKWTQKQVSVEAIYDAIEVSFPIPTTDPDGSTTNIDILFPPPVDSYEFIPREFSGDDAKVVIDVYREHEEPAIGAFSFAGSQLSKEEPKPTRENPIEDTVFHYDETKIYSLQAVGEDTPELYKQEPYFEVPKTSVTVHKDGKASSFYHPFVHKLLGKLMTGNLDALFNYYLNNEAELDEAELDEAELDDAYGVYSDTNSSDKKLYHELKRTYSLYNWEAAFHAPMLLVDRLGAAYLRFVTVSTSKVYSANCLYLNLLSILHC